MSIRARNHWIWEGIIMEHVLGIKSRKATATLLMGYQLVRPRSLAMYSIHYICQIYMMNENHCSVMEEKSSIWCEHVITQWTVS